MSKFKNKVAIITASATGIGYSIAEKLAKEGASVVISSRNQENINLAVEKLKKQNLNAIGCVCHVGKLQHLKKLINFTIENFGKIDIIVPNAAVSTFYGAFIDTPENAMDKMFSVNIKSVILFIQLSYPYLLKSETPNIVIISSIGAYESLKGIDFYSVTKAALLAITKNFSKEFMKDNIRVNCVAPGIIKTKFSKMLWKGNEKNLMNLLGINRLGESEDVANLVSFLASEEASYINGESVLVCGKPLPKL